jgi:hypothetical protein
MRLIAALALLLVTAPVASGDEVARDDRGSLRVEHRRGDLCLTFFHNRARFGESCGPTPYSTFRAVAVSGSNDRFGVAVDDGVAEIEVNKRSYATASAVGFEARFAIIRARGPSPILRFRDATGALVGAWQEAGGFDALPRGVAVRRARGVLVRVYRGRELRPDPLEIDRVVRNSCIDFQRLGHHTAMCVDVSAQPHVASVVLPPCRRAQGLIGGMVPAATQRVVAVLGNGDRRSTDILPLPPRYGTHSFLLPLPGGQAIRRLTAYDDAGQLVAREPVSAPPPRRDCPEPGGGELVADTAVAFDGLRPPGVSQVAATDGEHRLVVADAADPHGLCAGVDVMPVRSPCGRPSADPAANRVFRQGGAVAGVLGNEVASVDLELTDDTTLAVPTTAGEGYTGRYAGRLRFLVATVPRGVVRRAVLRDTAGHQVAAGRVRVADPEVVGRRTLAGLRVAALQDAGDVDAGSRPRLCVRLEGVGLGGLERLRDGLLCDDSARDAPMLALAPCDRSTSALVGVIPRSARGIRVRLADGRVTRPLLAKLGRSLLWIARPPRRAAVAAVVYRHDRIAFRLPPRARQCGYVGGRELAVR